MQEIGKKNTSIAKNTILLYIRMLIIMVVNLYASRLVLKQLGVEDFGVYNVVIIITYIRRGLRVVVPTLGQCEGLNSWNDNSRVPRFFCALL